MIKNIELKLSGSISVTRQELFELVSSHGRKDSILTNDNIVIDKCNTKECYDLSNLNVSKIENLSSIFKYSYYNGDLSKWDVSNCINMDLMFCSSNFNNNSLKDWNVSNVERMRSIFLDSSFNGDISNWNVSNVKIFNFAFNLSSFNGDISKWEFNKNVDCQNMFNNKNFKNKYNNCNEIPNHTKDFLKWFEENRFKIRDINTPKEEILDFFSFNNNLQLIK